MSTASESTAIVLGCGWLIAFIVALVATGSRSIGAGLVFLALTLALESDDWKARVPRK